MSTIGKMSDRAEVKVTILEAVVKGYHECSFAVRVGDKFVVKQKRGDRGPALRVTDDDRGQLGHLQRELVTVLWPSYMWCNVKECVRVLHCEVLDGKFCVDKQDMTFIKTKLPACVENERERVRREKEEKLEKIRKLKEGDPKDMTVILLREVPLEMGVNFKASDCKKKTR